MLSREAMGQPLDGLVSELITTDVGPARLGYRIDDANEMPQRCP